MKRSPAVPETESPPADSIPQNGGPPLAGPEAQDGPPASGTPAPGRGGPYLGALAGAVLLALYLVLLARADLATRLPGGWIGPGAVLALALAGVAALGARRVGWTAVGVRRWAAAHAVPLTLGAITLGAAGLRLLGLGFGLPYLDHPDEPAVADRALQILQSGDLNPHYFVYPNLFTYMEAAVFVPRFFSLVSGGALERLDQIVPSDFYLWGRALTAILGTLTVPLVYAAGRRLYGPAAGLIAAVFMAGNSLHIQHSQFITTDVPSAFFSALALLAIVHLLPAPAQRSAARPALPAPAPGPAPLPAYLAAGVAMGLAVGTKYNSALILLPFLLAHGFAVGRAPGALRRFFGARLWAALVVLAATFVLSTPFAVVDLPHFLNDLASIIGHYRFGHQGFESDYNWRVYVPAFLQSDFGPTLLALLGVGLAFVRHRRADIVLVSFPLVYYFAMSSYRVNFPRNLLPMLPFTNILAALALVVLWRALTRLGARRRAGDRRAYYTAAAAALAALVGLAVAPATLAAAARDLRQAAPDTRTLAAAWLDANTPPGSKIWMEAPPLQLTPDRYLTGSGDHLTNQPPTWYVANRYDYIVANAEAFKDVLDHPDHNPALHDAYTRFFAENAGRQVFEATKEDHYGPTLRIYRTGYVPPASAAAVTAGHPVGGLFTESGPDGGAIRLIAADLPPTATVGSTLPLVLYWGAERPVHADYTVFVHLLDAAGTRVAQRDTGPRDGTAPTSGWRAGSVVVDEAGLHLPSNLAPGSYILHVGLYVQSSGAALAVSGVPGDCKVCVVLGPVQVTPAGH